MSEPIERIPPFGRTGHEIERAFASAVTARSGAIVKPLAHARGSDQSHDRKGVISQKSTKPRGHGTSHMRRQS
jgi:hypothetical protein